MTGFSVGTLTKGDTVMDVPVSVFATVCSAAAPAIVICLVRASVCCNEP
jgi:hypothetical protein